MLPKAKVPSRLMGHTVPRESTKNVCFVLPLNYFSVLLIFLLSAQTLVPGQPQSLNTSNFEAAPKTTSPSCTVSHPDGDAGELRISCSGYTTIPTENVPRKHEITLLDMSSGNSLQNLTSGQLERANLPKLSRLVLQHCQINAIQPGAFRGGHSLQQLYLENNQIEFLDPQVFDGLTNLQSLSLDNNPIKEFQVGTVFPPLPSLTRLSLSSCNLSSIADNTFGELVNLRKLNLYNNTLTLLSWTLVRNLKALETLSFRNNSLHCDCQVRFLVDVLDEMSIKLKGYGCGMGMSSENKTHLSCAPEVEEFRLIREVKIGDYVNLECVFSGYPAPTVKWLKDGNLIQIVRNKYSERNMTDEIVSKFDTAEMKRNIRFKEVLIVHNVTASDSGTYTCLVKNEGGQREDTVVFKLPLFSESSTDFSVEASHTQCGIPIWLWILILSLGTVILIFLIVIVILILRIRRNEKQDVSLGLEELYCIREAISEQEASPRNFAYSSKVTNPLLD